MEMTITQPWLTQWLFSLLSEIKKTIGSLFPPGFFSTLPRGSNPLLESGSSRDLTVDYKNSLLHEQISEHLQQWVDISAMSSKPVAVSPARRGLQAVDVHPEVRISRMTQRSGVGLTCL